MKVGDIVRVNQAHYPGASDVGIILDMRKNPLDDAVWYRCLFRDGDIETMGPGDGLEVISEA